MSKKRAKIIFPVVVFILLHPSTSTRPLIPAIHYFQLFATGLQKLVPVPEQ
jgi:hypothetical protein